MNSLRTRRALTLISFISLIASAGIMPMFGPLLTSIARSFGMSVEAASVIVPVQLLGFLTTVLIAGHLGDYFGKRTVVMVGLALGALSLLGMGLVHSWFVLVTLQLFLGFGLGASIGSAVALMSELNTEARAGALGFSQVATGAGALVAIGIAGVLVRRGDDWTVPILIMALLNALVFLLYLPFPLAHRAPSQRLRDSRGMVNGLLRSPLIPLLVFINALTVGTQQVLMTFSAPYLELNLGTSVATAALAPFAFWVGITVGRSIFSVVIERLDKDRVWIICSALTGLVLVLILFVHLPLGIIGLMGLCGGFIGALVPGTLDRSHTAHPNQTGLATGVLFAASGVGSIVMTLLTTNLSASTSLEAAFWVTTVAMGLNVCLIVLFVRRFDFPSLRKKYQPTD